MNLYRSTVHLLHINSSEAVFKHKFVLYTRCLKDQTKPKQKNKAIPHTYIQIYLVNDMVYIFEK